MGLNLLPKGLALLVLLQPAILLAQEAEIASEAPTRSAPDTMVTLLSLGAGLLAVIALIFGCAWIIRRMTGLTGVNNRSMKVVSVMTLGTRERVALVDVAGTQILLGITPSSIRTLHVFDEPVVTPGEGGSSDFAKRLQEMMGKHRRPQDGDSR